MDAKNLSARLAQVATYVPQGARMADIGSDHAYLPVHLMLNERISYGIAGEVAQGPLDNALNEIKRFRFADNIQARLADGLAAVKPEDNIDTVVVAGMGGRLITQILTAGHANGERYERLILQPNVDQALVRTWLMENGYALVAETVLFDDGHYYEIVVAEPGAATYSQAELTYGPFNLAEPTPAWTEKWRREADRIQAIMDNLTRADKEDTSAYQEYAANKHAIDEVLGNASK